MQATSVLLTRRAVQLLALLLSLALSPWLASAEPRPIPRAEWDDTTKLVLAQAMVGEADWHLADHVAIAYVLARRWQQLSERRDISFRAYIPRYSTALRGDTARRRWLLALPWSDISGRYREPWERVRRLVSAWGDGSIPDPCPRAVHWGGTMDQPAGHLVAVDCGMTRNIFYRRSMHARTGSAATRSAIGKPVHSE